MKTADCLHLGDCSAVARLDGLTLDCDGCEKFSKWKELQNPIKSDHPEPVERQSSIHREEVSSPMKEMRKCALKSCGIEFEAHRRDMLFHSRSCREKYHRQQKENGEKDASNGRRKKNPGNGRRKKNKEYLIPKEYAFAKVPAKLAEIIDATTVHVMPTPKEAMYLPLGVINAIKKAAVLDFVKNDLPDMVEKRFA